MESDMPNVSSLRAEVKECCGRMFWESDMPNVSSLRAEVKECCGRIDGVRHAKRLFATS